MTYERNERTGRLERVRRSWKISRGCYYHKSGTVRQNQQQSTRQGELKQHWNAMMGDDCGLHSVVLEDIRNYLERYAAVEAQCWEHALATIEAVTNLKRYIGKRSAMDGFFARIKKQVQKAYPGRVIKVAYGSAVNSMKPTGLGEVAAPVSEACCRVFGPKHVHVVDEFRTTKIDWASGEEKEMAYKVLERDAASGKCKEILRHTAAARPPVAASPEHRAAVERYNQRVRHQENRRRGGCGGMQEEQGGEGQQSQVRYPEVRGLRFNKKLRMFCDRDLDSALTIGRLLVMELLKLGRPAPFCRS